MYQNINVRMKLKSNGILTIFFQNRDNLSRTRMTYQKIMGASDSLRQKKIKFFCPILDTSTYAEAYVLHQMCRSWPRY